MKETLLLYDIALALHHDVVKPRIFAHHPMVEKDRQILYWIQEVTRLLLSTAIAMFQNIARSRWRPRMMVSSHEPS
jgi:hypothetical protein